MNGRLAIVLALAAGGCAAALTEAGREVRPVEGAAISRCTRIGSVEASAGNGASTAENEGVATDVVRNKVAKLGGNAYVITERDAGRIQTTVRAGAYRCPQWEPVRGLAPR